MGESVFFKKAVQLAREGQGRTGSIPSAGCVIVKDGAIMQSLVSDAPPMGGDPTLMP
jgi:pyrimidine deaminase RibD-like protein